jgi:hypothetical protein
VFCHLNEHFRNISNREKREAKYNTEKSKGKQFFSAVWFSKENDGDVSEEEREYLVEPKEGLVKNSIYVSKMCELLEVD